jgi:hypothetical protein
MPQSYEGLGIALMYPDGWKVDIAEDGREDSGVSFESPCGAFISITRYAAADAESALRNAQEVMESEYEEVETEEFTKNIANFEFHVVEQRFVYLDFIIVSQLLSFKIEDRTYLVQIQGEDRDIDNLQMVFDAMLTSIFRPVAASKH